MEAISPATRRDTRVSHRLSASERIEKGTSERIIEIAIAGRNRDAADSQLDI